MTNHQAQHFPRLSGPLLALFLAAGCLEPVGYVGDVDRTEGGGAGGAVARGGIAGMATGIEGGRDGGAGSGDSDRAGHGGEEAGAPSVVVSEILYHPVLEDDRVENHEFIELANPSEYAVNVGGLELRGTVSFTVPDETTIDAHGYLVIAKNRERLLADVPSYELDPDRVLGNYTGELSNRRGTIILQTAAGERVDGVSYEDAFPWPIAADAFGASEQFFPADDARRPFTEHRYRGHSLERVNLALPATDIANWAPSDANGPTPGRVNSASAAVLPTIVERVTALPLGAGDGIITPDEPVVVEAALSSSGANPPKLEWFVEYRDSKPTEEAPQQLTFDLKDDSAFVAVLPAQPGNSIVRYRLLDESGERLSPRPSDPNPWHSYAVVPIVPGNTRPIHLFIAQAQWGKLHQYVSGGRVRGDGCTANADWDTRVPAVLVLDGRVYDVRVRYQGSPYNRSNGPTFSAARPYQGLGPTGGPSPLKALSWSVLFPRYAPLPDGRRHLHLNKLTQACPGGLTTTVMSQLFAEAKVLALKVFGFHRIYVNGGYYHYAMDREHIDEEMLDRVQPKDTPIGDLFKVVGYHKDQGPWGIGDSRLLSSNCGFAPDARYSATYERQTHDWTADSSDVRNLLEALNAARAADLQTGDANHPELKRYFAANFDVESLLAYRAVFNWANVWDDYWQNHFFYRRGDGKWVLIPYDFDGLMSGDTAGSFYLGEQNDRSARSCCDSASSGRWWNVLADGLIKAYRSDFNAKLHELNASVLSPENVTRVVDGVVAQSGYHEAEARSAPAGTACVTDYASAAVALKTFAVMRSIALRNQVAKP